MTALEGRKEEEDSAEEQYVSPFISAASSRPVLVGSAAGWASRAWLDELLGGRIGLRGCAASGSRS